jgi:hypothetical protein
MREKILIDKRLPSELLCEAEELYKMGFEEKQILYEINKEIKSKN